MEVLMPHSQTPPLSARYHERNIDISDPTDERIQSDRVHWLSAGATRRSAFDNNASGKPSAVRRLLRGFARFFFAVLIGITATLGWQSYGDEAKEIVRAWDPSLDWLVPSSVAKPACPRNIGRSAAATQIHGG